MPLSDRELQRQKLREGQSGATRISLKVASPLESLISACADAQNRTLKDFVDQLADLANLEDLLSAGQKNNGAVDSGASRTKMWRQAVKWVD